MTRERSKISPRETRTGVRTSVTRPMAGIVTAIWCSVAGIAPATLSGAGPAEEWFNPSTISVTTSEPNRRDFSTVRMAIANNGDAQVEESSRIGAKRYSGSMMVISGTRLLVKDVELSPGTEIDAIDAPALEVRLALELLARAFPGGPGSVRSVQKVNLADAAGSITVNTQSASGVYPAPWSLEGKASTEGGRRTFDFTFSFAGAADTLHIVGTWEHKEDVTALPDSTSVAGWRVFALGPYSRQDGGGTIFDYGAQEIRKRFANLGEIRRDASEAR